MSAILAKRHLTRGRSCRSFTRGRRRKRIWTIERLEDRSMLANFTVNSLSDTVDVNPGDGLAQDVAGMTTLRSAVMEANSSAGDDVIALPSGTYTLSLAGPNEDDAATGDLDVKSNGRLTIAGTGSDSTIIDAAALDRVFHVLLAADFSASGITLRNGKNVLGGAGPPDSGAGMLNSGTATIDSSIVSDNSTDGSGGGIRNEEGAAFTISDSTVAANATTFFGSGAGISNSGVLTIFNSLISSNTSANFGGGIYNFSSGNVTIVGTTIRGNSAAGFTLYGQGGGIHNTGMLTISSSTISGNLVTGTSQFPASVGGGIYNQSGSATITNSTITSNSAQSGGGILNSGDMTIRSSTIAGNSSSAIRPFGGAGPAGIGNGASGTLAVENTIIAENRVLSGPPPGPPDCSGHFDSLGNNLIGNSLSSTGWIASDLQNVDPLLGPLADNGGPTMTHELLPDSPAIDAGNNDARRKPISAARDARAMATATV